MNYQIKRILIALMLLLPSLGAFAQEMPQLPIDPDVRVGKLPNGLTYYIRHNEYPKGQADFYIAQNVGSVLEEDNQRGLAHFLEHMCFNGTTHFPGKEMINWLESVGVKFGVNLNASTGTDQTVYNISNVPVARTGVQDSCLLVLHDWANDLLLDPEEIDAERAVIHEEWRTNQGGQMRAIEPLLPVMYPGSKYGYRLPIGTMDVVDNFPHQALRDYYERWYRPDQQAVIVVGDIDVDRIENTIRTMFSDIEMPADAPERVQFPVPDTPGTIYAIGHDKEMPNTLAQLMFKSDVLPDSLRNTPLFYQDAYLRLLLSTMINEHFNDVASRADAPFAVAQILFDNYFLAKTKDAMTLVVLSKDNNIVDPTAAAYRELLRLARGGFTPGQFKRAKAEIQSQVDKTYNERNTRQNSAFVSEYVDNFLDHTPIPSIDVEYQLMTMLGQAIPLEVANQALASLITDDNRVLLALMPDNAEGVYPTEADFEAALKAVDNEDIEPLKEEAKAEPFIESIRPAGKIVSEKPLPQWGDNAVEWSLSNGARVILKPTTYKENEILFLATAVDGYQHLSDDLAPSLLFMSTALRAPGYGSYTNADLQKYLAGKQVDLTLSFSAYRRSLNGSAIPADLPYLMELIYQSFGHLNYTDEEFAALQNAMIGMLHAQESNPQFIFGQRVSDALFASPKSKQLDAATVAKADRQQIIDIANAMTANAADYTFVFAGTIDLDTMRPLVEKYIASLPGDPATAVHALPGYDHTLDAKGGRGTDIFAIPMETPQTYAYVLQWGTAPYSMLNAQLTGIAGQILSKRLLDIVREKEGAVYSIWASGSMDRLDNQPVQITSAFPMKPEKRDRVIEIINEQLADMAQNITPEELATVQEYMVKQYEESREKNEGWISAIGGWTYNGIDTFNGNVDSVKAITPAQVSEFVKALIDQNNFRVVVVEPAE